MAIVNGYCTLAELKSALRITDSTDDTLLESAIESASRRIDGYTGRFFYKTSQTAVPMYPYNEYLVDFGRDVANTSVTIKIDTNADGTYATTLTQGVDYVLQPRNVPIFTRPYESARMVGGATFPLYTTPSFETVQVTAEWGWESIPDDVNQATILLAMRQFARLNAALGVVGFADMAITVRAVDPDVRDLLAQYRRFGIA
jgi:hypothetical protein